MRLLWGGWVIMDSTLNINKPYHHFMSNYGRFIERNGDETRGMRVCKVIINNDMYFDYPIFYFLSLALFRVISRFLSLVLSRVITRFLSLALFRVLSRFLSLSHSPSLSRSLALCLCLSVSLTAPISLSLSHSLYNLFGWDSSFLRSCFLISLTLSLSIIYLFVSPSDLLIYFTTQRSLQWSTIWS